MLPADSVIYSFKLKAGVCSPPKHRGLTLASGPCFRSPKRRCPKFQRTCGPSRKLTASAVWKWPKSRQASDRTNRSVTTNIGPPSHRLLTSHPNQTELRRAKSLSPKLPKFHLLHHVESLGTSPSRRSRCKTMTPSCHRHQPQRAPANLFASSPNGASADTSGKTRAHAPIRTVALFLSATPQCGVPVPLVHAAKILPWRLLRRLLNALVFIATLPPEPRCIFF